VEWNSVAPSGRRSNRLTTGESARRRRAGFTLVEVIVVLVILAILAAIAIPALTGYIDKANTSQIKAKARSAAVAMQTILSEAYADPQTYLPEIYNGVGGKVYIDGKQISTIRFTLSDKIGDVPDDMYTVGLEDNQNMVDLFRKLDPSALYNDGEYDRPAIRDLYVNEHLSIQSYVYIEPETYGTEDERYCTYNYDLNGENRIDLTAGFKVWSVDADGNYVPIG
jgi:type IV pilus assembly protein PilA